MNKNTLLLAALLFAMPLVEAAETTQSAEPMQFDKFWMVFLMRPETPQDHGETRNKELQAEHLAHLGWLWEEGYAHVAGPFGGKPGDPMRGIVLLRGDLDEDRARELAEMDPRVQAGQLEVDIRPWYTGAGYLAFPQSPAPTNSNAASSAAKDPATVVQASVEAYNRRNFEAFSALLAPDVKLYEFPHQLMYKSAEEARSDYRQLFNEAENLRAEVLSRTVHGRYVVDRETIHGMPGKEPTTSVAIYKVESGLIQAIWFID